MSSRSIQRPGGKVLTPWTLRRWPQLAKHIIDAMCGREAAYFTFVRDCPWVVSDEVFQELLPLMGSS